MSVLYLSLKPSLKVHSNQIQSQFLTLPDSSLASEIQIPLAFYSFEIPLGRYGISTLGISNFIADRINAQRVIDRQSLLFVCLAYNL